MALEEDELYAITGGGIKYGVWLALGGLITFLCGVVDGYLRPLACNK